MKPRDVLQVVVSDFHTGSNYALFPDRHWEGTNGNTHTPNSKQVEIREQFIKFTDEVRKVRSGKKVRLIHNGDAIDGDHHASNDVCTTNELEQSDLHIELMNELQKRIGWQRGDEMYYTRGTQTHVHDMEEYIAREMNAVGDGEYLIFDVLKLNTNGVMSWFAHHGPKAGKGANEGNSVRNWLKNFYIDALRNGEKIPDVIYTGHVHQPTYSVYTARLAKFSFMNMHGIILPSWQAKTRYAYKVAAMERNQIGGVYQEIKADGSVQPPVFSVLDMMK